MATFTFDTTAVRDYTIVDHGGLDNTAPVTLSASDLTILQYTTDGDVVLSQNGTGTLSSGGFAIGEHLRFSTNSGSRWFTFTYDTVVYNQIEIAGIKGNGSNGGEEPDPGENLILQYLDGGGNWVTIDTIIAENDTSFNTLNTAVIALPQAAQNNNQAFRLYQESASGSSYDHYGISSITFTETLSGGSPTEDYGLLTTTATATEEYQEIVFTDVAYPFGKAKISGGAQAAVSSAPPSRTVEITTQGISTESNTSVWVGSGTAFEMAGGQELIVAPWTVASGVLRTFRTTNSFVGSGNISIRDRYQIENTTEQERVVTQISADPEEYEVSYISVPTVREIDEDVRFSPSYNTSSVEYFEDGTDYGSVTQSSSTNLDNGNLQEGSYGGADYGLVNVTQDDYPFLPALNVYGDAATKYLPVYTKVGTGLFNFTGESATEFKPNWRGRGGIFIAGSAQDSFIRPAIIEGGSIVSFNESENSASYRYTESSVEEFNSNDFGQITATGSSADYGTVTEGSYAAFDYGYVINLDTVEPYGLFSLQGYAEYAYKPTFTHHGSGSISIYDHYTFTKFNPHWRGRGGFSISGGEGDVFSRPAVVEGGSLVSFNESANSAAYSYNESSVEEFNSNDFGQITASGSSTDYGTVTEGAYAGFDYGYVINTDIVEPYGLYTFSGSATTSFKPTFTQIGTGLFAISGVSENEFKPHWRGRGGIFITGGEGDVFSRPAVVEGGSIVSFNESTNSAAYSYNESSVEEFSSNDFGQITTTGSTTDYGSVTEGSYAGFDYGYVINLDTVEPYGLYTFGGSAKTSFKPTFTQIATGLFAISGVSENEFKPHWRGRGGIFITGGEADSFTRPAVVEGGSLVSFNQSANSAAYSYNESSIELFSNNDFGQITATGSTTDYGTVTEGAYAGFDHGYVFNTFDQYPLDINSLFSISGVADVEYNPELKQIGTGLYDVTGVAETAFIPNWNGSGLINLTGGEKDSVVKVFTGTGSLFSIIDSEERAAYSYNESSIEFFSDTDFGQITATGSSADYGTVTEGSYAAFDHGYVFNVLDEYPLDINSLFAISGVANVEYNPNLLQIGTGLYNVTGVAETAFIPNWNGSGSINLTGGEGDSVIKVFTGTGSLFSIIDSEERAAYSYNESSIEFFNNVDLGTVTATGSSTDYGTVTEGSYAAFDHGYVFNVLDEYPLDINSLFAISGVANVEYNPELKQIGTGLYDVTGVAKTAFIPNWNGSGSINLTGGERDSVIKVFTGTGSLFSIIDSEERAAYSYNESSIEFFSDTDFGQITATGSSTDYGTVTEGSYAAFDYGYVVNVLDEYPLDINSLFAISGSANVEYLRNLVQIGTGLYNVTGVAKTAYIPNWNGRGSINLTGGEGDSVAKSFAGTGSLFSIIDSEEKAAYSYNESSIVFFNNVDLGTVTATGTTVDYGNLTDGSYGGLDYGYVVSTQDDYPLDINSLFAISGSADVEFLRNLVQIGTGLYDVTGVAKTAYIPNWNGRGSINLSGGERDSVVKAFTATGSLFHIGEKIEKATFSYNGSSIDYFNDLDRGSITSSGSQEDNGTVAEDSYAGLDYGTVINTSDTYPFGSVSISGGSADSAELKVIVGGNLFGFGGAAEAVSWQTPENTALYTFNGGYSNLKASVSEVGSGSLFNYKGQSAPDDFTFRPHWRGSGVLRLSGEEGFARRRDYFVRDGAISFSGSAHEAFVAQTPEDTVLFTYSGTRGSEKATAAEVGSGSLFAIGTLVEAQTDHYTVPVSTSLFGVSGAADVAQTDDYNSRGGTLKIYTDDTAFNYRNYRPSPRYVNSEYGFIGGQLNIAGELDEAFTQPYIGSGNATVTGIAGTDRARDYVGTGSFNSFSGAAESRAIAINAETSLYRAFGSGDDTFTRNVIGSGSLFAASGAAESRTFAKSVTGLFNIAGDQTDTRYVPNFNGSGTLSITNSGDDSFGRILIGSGSFFSAGGAAEAFVAQTPENTALYSFNGTATESFSKGNYDGVGSVFTSGFSTEKQTDAYAGTGSLFATGGAAESRTIIAEDNTVLFTINLNTEYVFIRGPYPAGGSLFAAGGAAEAFVAQTPENTALYSFFGNRLSEKRTSSEVGSGSLFTAGSGAESRVISQVAKTDLFTLTGSAEESFSQSPYRGTGSLFTSSGAAEAFSAQTPENTVLYTFSGTRLSEKRTSREIGSGSLFSTGGITESRTIARSQTGLFNIAGESIEIFTRGAYPSSGSLFAAGGAAEAFSAQTPENTALYTFFGNRLNESKTTRLQGSGSLFSTGGASESRTFAKSATGLFEIAGQSFVNFIRGPYPSSGSLFAAGGAAEAFSAQTPENTALYTFFGNRLSESKTTRLQGSGSLFAFSGSVERVAVAEESTGLFSISGASEFNFTRGAYPSSGSLFATGGAAESRTIIAEDNTILFTASGTADERFTRSSTTESAQYSFSGELAESKTSSEVGSGSLFSAGGAAEVAVVSPESTGLFKFNGSTEDTFTRNVIGSGSLFSVGSADEAKTTFIPIDPGFYRLVGSADESFTPAPHIGFGSATLSGTTSPEIRTLAKHGSGSATISGTAEPVIRTHAFQGSGTITLSGQTEFKLKYQTDATTILFTYQGGEGDAFTRIARTNTVEIRIDGESENRSILFTPPRIFGTII